MVRRDAMKFENNILAKYSAKHPKFFFQRRGINSSYLGGNITEKNYKGNHS